MGHSIDLDHVTALTVRAQAGDGASFDALVEVLTPPVLRLCHRFLGNAGEAQDAFQETVLRAWRRLDTLRDPQATLAWVSRIARHVSIDMIRANTRRRTTSINSHGEGGVALVDTLVAHRGNPERDLERKRARGLLNEALCQLPPRFREVLWLREIEGRTYQEISAALGLRPGTVESRLHRARRQLAVVVQSLAAPP